MGEVGGASGDVGTALPVQLACDQVKKTPWDGILLGPPLWTLCKISGPITSFLCRDSSHTHLWPLGSVQCLGDLESPSPGHQLLGAAGAPLLPAQGLRAGRAGRGV